MKATEANQININTYLGNLGIKPAKISRESCFYLSPYRTEKTPSFKVCNCKNLWIDYGDGNSGGSLIDLVLKMNPGMGVSEAITEISKISGLQHPIVQLENQNEIDNEVVDDSERKIKILKIKELGNNLALTSYLHSRGIGLDTAKPFCKEIYYCIDDKRFFAIGNQNENGWNIRNKYWKGCSAQGYSYFNNKSDQLCVFEGIFDLLSYREIQNNSKNSEDYLVLNSLVNIPKALQIFKKYEHVDLFLDQDEAGKKASRSIQEVHPICQDLGNSIYPFKDMNEYLTE
jgi:hypothetical protein